MTPQAPDGCGQTAKLGTDERRSSRTTSPPVRMVFVRGFPLVSFAVGAEGHGSISAEIVH